MLFDNELLLLVKIAKDEKIWYDRGKLKENSNQ